jgi:hypothetical protein
MSILNKLTEGIVNRDLKKEGTALLSKWERTGLLEGLGNDRTKNGMARLLENQAKELLREASTMSGGDVEGFAAVAFPIVRRVFGGLIANDLVSVQPMSLPSGLIFFMDFQMNSVRLTQTGSNYSNSKVSLYGGGRVASEITGGVSLSGDDLERGFYSLAQGYASPTGSATFTTDHVVVASGVVGSGTGDDVDGAVTVASIGGSQVATSLSKLVKYDPDLSGSAVVITTAPGLSGVSQLNLDNLISITGQGTSGAANAGSSSSYDIAKCRQVKRLTQLIGRSADKKDAGPRDLDVTNATDTSFLMVWESTASNPGSHDGPFEDVKTHLNAKDLAVTFAIDDKFQAGGAIGSVVGASTWGLENEENIPEIDLKVDSVAVTAKTKKLKAKWTPELGQDLNAYHNLDAEVELTSILSEQIALEIDREILNDLVQGATAATYYWARMPGMFVERETGAEVGAATKAPDFTGTVSEWYETLIETINDVSAQIHRKTLRGGANYVVCSPEVANILEFTSGFRASVTHDDDKGQIGAVKTGSLSRKFDVYVDPYFPRNVVLVGRQGGSFLESGYVYAPYVPLQVTPTIFGVEDFVPRKGVMTRYAKKMVRPDMYGLVIVRGLLGESGSES